MCDANLQTVPPNRVDAGFPQDCRCNMGYSHRALQDYNTTNAILENVCFPCTPGYYNPMLGTKECSPCGPGYFSPTNASLSISNCMPCAPDTFSMAGEKICTACGENAQAPGVSGYPTDCICKPWYTGENGAACSACVAGKYKLEPGSALCTNCLDGQYSTVVGATSNVCQWCVVNAQSPAGSGALISCICNTGATGPAIPWRTATKRSACVPAKPSLRVSRMG